MAVIHPIPKGESINVLLSISKIDKPLKAIITNKREKAAERNPSQAGA